MRGKSKDILNDSEVMLAELGQAIKNQRLKKDFSQLSVADACGVKRPYLSDIEKGRYMPSLITMIKLACAIDYDLNCLKGFLINEVKIPERNRRVFMKQYNSNSKNEA